MGSAHDPPGTRPGPPLGPGFGGMEVDKENRVFECPSGHPLLRTGSWTDWEVDKLHLSVSSSAGVCLDPAVPVCLDN